MSLRVAQAGFFTTVQDLGRYGHQRDGVSPSGAMDHFALRAANLLVGNADDDAVLEITLAGPTLVFEADALIALAGGDLGAQVGARALLPWRVSLVPRGNELTFVGERSGCRAYLAVAGGIDVPLVLGSRSTYVRAAFGGYRGRPLEKGDVLAVGEPCLLSQRILGRLPSGESGPATPPWGLGPSLRPLYSRAPLVRVVVGAHESLLKDDSRTAFWNDSFRLSPQSDRMGLRLEGPRLMLAESCDVLSEAVAFGTIQLPPDGNPIVLMADRQTTGGYPRLGEVASVDLPLLARLCPGDEVRFRQVSLAESRALYLSREQDLRQARREIELRHS